MRLRDFLFINNIPQDTFAERLGVSRQHLNAVMNGRLPCKKMLAELIERLTKEVQKEHYVKAEEMLSEYSKRKKNDD